MARRWWKPLLIGVIAVPLLVCFYDSVETIKWVGSTDLEVAFAVTDAVTGMPVAGARVEIHQEKGGFYEDRDEKQFTLVCGPDGLANRECRGSMCFGTLSGLKFTDTFAVHSPHWQFRVVAGAYEQTEWLDMDDLASRRRARRAGPGKATLVVPVGLHGVTPSKAL